MDFVVPMDHRMKIKEIEKQQQIFGLYTNYNWCFWYSHQSINKGTQGLENKRMSGDHSNCCIIEVGQNTEKSPGDWIRRAVTQTPLKDHQLTLMWKTLKE